MKNVIAHDGILEIVKRLPSSRLGNPRFLIRVDGWTASTTPDSMMGYAVQNYEGKRVVARLGTHYGKLQVDSVTRVISA